VYHLQLLLMEGKIYDSRNEWMFERMIQWLNGNKSVSFAMSERDIEWVSKWCLWMRTLNLALRVYIEGKELCGQCSFNNSENEGSRIILCTGTGHRMAQFTSRGPKFLDDIKFKLSWLLPYINVLLKSSGTRKPGTLVNQTYSWVPLTMKPVFHC
jgi:hypothetical protein